VGGKLKLWFVDWWRCPQGGVGALTASPKNGLASSSAGSAAFNPDFDTSPKNFEANHTIRISISSLFWIP
jgi:hypothetical protein